jgi:predicted RNA-binding protein with PUA-like domain
MAYWLMKSEPSIYGIDELARDGKCSWEGVRNYQARNYMRDGMQPGDLALFYHSSCATPAVVGVMEVTRAAYPDPAQFDERSPYYDPASPRDVPRWVAVDVKFVRKLGQPIPLERLKADKRLAGLALLRRGNRLSVMPVTAAEWKEIFSAAEPGQSGSSPAGAAAGSARRRRASQTRP